ncbi:MAG: Rrf2 family transcriptional regulator [Candidatus Omnitrophica bacterium]|nr:Rrf2 family transcriptional regulator [Candidatus Omnitrophota bacterium]MCK5287589.1 Rrf2 family transcriptional regulator [Candidatus Omnitrophota bacterium]MCK5393046.1 Rrf2 family transcriptional regulator [Candidatus Omnitrophota bacterium]
MRVSARTRYGVRLIFCLALNYGKGPVFLKEIAGKEGISEKYLSQIIIPLRGVGLVNSIRGAHGGYMLGKDPVDIKVKDIVKVLDKDFNFVEINEKNILSSRRTVNCINQLVWDKLEKSISKTLEDISLKSIVDNYRDNENNILMYNI